jgi:hypothetical protein
MEDPGAGNLGCDQKRGHDGRHADQPQELIHRKHCLRPHSAPTAGFNSPFVRPADWSAPDRNRSPHRLRSEPELKLRPTSAWVNDRFGLWPKTSKAGSFSGRSRDQSWPSEGKPRQAVFPASIVITEPVILRPPSPNRYSTMRATSSVSGSRRSALRLAIRLR